nr:transposase, MuDR, MULE transposase domain protein [Tanacetum cinerariifolium]
MLPYYCYNLERKNQGSVIRIKTDDKGVFEMLFIALGASIRTFLNYLRPLLIIDAANLKGKYKGTNLVAVGIDGNNQIVPIAFANMNRMQVVQPDAYHKLCQAGTKRWSRAHCPLVHYNYMPSNSVESVNACRVINRKLPVLKLAETYRAMLQDWYFERQKLRANMKYEITDWVADKVHKRKLKSATWIVHEVNQYVYQVSNGRYNLQVNLETGVRECRKWQLSEIPCGYVIAVTRFLRLTDCVQYVSDWFKKDKYQGTYAKSIHFLGDMQEWEFPIHIHPVIPPLMDNPQPCRPKNTNRILSQEVDGAFVTSWRMLFVIPTTNVVKLIGFTKDDDPIVEVDRGRTLHPLQVHDRTSQEFHNVVLNTNIPAMDFEDMVSYLTRKIPKRFTTLYYTLPSNHTLSGLKAMKNDYDTNVMYDIVKVAGKLQIYAAHHPIDLSTVLIPNDGSLEKCFAVRQTLLKRLQTKLQAEVTLANKLSCELTRVAEQMRIHGIHMAMLHAMPLTSLNSYGLHALRMTHDSDIRITHNLRTTRDELLRNIVEKQKFINNYKAI